MEKNKLFTFVEYCAGAGGFRIGLEAAGWRCAASYDIDASAVEVHRLALGDCRQIDVLRLDPADVPKHDVLVAGFPCQPFSSSGNRSGFGHSSGTVFGSIVDCIDVHEPNLVVLENVRGLLSNANGYTMAVILDQLTSRGYVVEWFLIDAAWLGVPQSRPRVFFIAKRDQSDQRNSQFLSPAFRSILLKHPSLSNLVLGASKALSIEEVLTERLPEIGRPKPSPTTPFGPFGIASGDDVVTCAATYPGQLQAGHVGEICSPSLTARHHIRSVRYWGHSGETKPYFKREAIAHCIGTNIGAGPTFGIPKKYVRGKNDRRRLLEFANWHREQDDYLVFRLTPERAVQLFGEHTELIAKAFEHSAVPDTKKYVILGNLVAPIVAESIAQLSVHAGSEIEEGQMSLSFGQG